MQINIPKIGSIPAIGLGTWKLNGKVCTATIKEALELGYRHIDTAQAYQNHESIAEGIKGFPREQLFLVSKINDFDLDPQKVPRACEIILQELNTPYLDLLLIHWPSEKIPTEQTLEAMIKLKEKGLVRHIGVSNFLLIELHKLKEYHFPIFCNQIELHPYLQEYELVEYCQAHNMIVVAYRPIQRATVMEENLLIQLGEKYEKTPVQITLRWLFQRNIASIPKATSKEHLKENLDIFNFSLSGQEMNEIAKIDRERRFVF